MRRWERKRAPFFQEKKSRCDSTEQRNSDRLSFILSPRAMAFDRRVQRPRPVQLNRDLMSKLNEVCKSCEKGSVNQYS